ncbi:MarR family winged helix-turn-helix transcriptional regulator [Sphingobium cloacae]|uniref:MarR family transcriptional regulator n=1 Tax=Sphingobium cloacae TaxID=120107 RepID=A0A1E1EZB2_9SPHN|nr:MarR family transcriptional regulator [Sphingobium cloacae]BAV63609.1 MarR family transcriptional regulator [Sphingobium cloacae]
MTGEGGNDDFWLDGETKVAESPGDHGEETRLWLRLLTCSTLVETEVRRRLRDEFGFTLPRFDLLAQLERAHDGMVLGEISKRMMVSPGNLTALVERLVESGHVTRSPSTEDRRVQIVALTPYGRDAFRSMAERHGEWIGDFFGDLSTRDRQRLITALGKLKQSVRKALANRG